MRIAKIVISFENSFFCEKDVNLCHKSINNPRFDNGTIITCDLFYGNLMMERRQFTIVFFIHIRSLELAKDNNLKKL
jgi:hypothetical protein